VTSQQSVRERNWQSSISFYCKDTIKLHARALGHMETTKIGTLRWCKQNDSSATHRSILSGPYKISELPKRLFSPHHLAKEMEKNQNGIDGTTLTRSYFDVNNPTIKPPEAMKKNKYVL
jgi:hypothetical protein